MKKTVRISLLFLVILSLLTSSSMSCFAAGSITYNGNAKKFIYGYESKYSPTDLFENFKNIMPGDHLTQKIAVRNDSTNEVKVDIYIRSLGAHDDSNEFLSRLHMTVAKSDENDMAYMFDTAANQTGNLSEWVLLGTLYSGGEVNLDITLDVPIDLENEYENAIGSIDWQFKIEEFPIEDSDPKPPQTGDYSNLPLWLFLVGISSLVIVYLVSHHRRNIKTIEREA